MKKIFAKFFILIFGGMFLASIIFLNVWADETENTVAATQYTFGEKGHYDTNYALVVNSIENNTDYGKFCIKGNIKKVDEVEGFDAYEIKDGYITMSYDISNTLFDAKLDEWHIENDKSKVVDGIELEQNIMTGTVIVQSSLDGENWVTDSIWTDINGEKKTFESDFYTTKDLQQINGCFYKVIVAYKVAKRTKIKKIVPDEYEYSKFLEVYSFYAINKIPSNRKNLSPEYGNKTVYKEVVSVEKDKGYDIGTAKALDIDNPHFGWNLGYFTVNGYTDESSETNNSRVFLKTVGDEVTLWFTLNQDISRLNDNDTLSISEDSNGYDKNYQINKTNFKHGALIVVYTDETGNKHDPVIYTDFLAANTKTGADTRIQLYEEGEYEVSLDYEIKSTPRKVGSIEVVPSYTNYKMKINFSIRNGNSMVFPKDVKTGSELKDGEWTANGFSVDVAASKYLKIDVKDEEININDSGLLSRDIRKNTVSSDGGTFTKAGIYTVSVSSKYVAEPTRKVIYVGDDKYIKCIVKNRYTVEQINEKIRECYTVEDDGTLLPPPEPIVEEEPEEIEEIVDAPVEEQIENQTEEQLGNTDTSVAETPIDNSVADNVQTEQTNEIKQTDTQGLGEIMEDVGENDDISETEMRQNEEPNTEIRVPIYVVILLIIVSIIITYLFTNGKKANKEDEE